MIQFCFLALAGLLHFADCCYPKVHVKNSLDFNVSGTVELATCDYFYFGPILPGNDQIQTEHRGQCLIYKITAYYKEDGVNKFCQEYKAGGTSYSQFSVIKSNFASNGCQVIRYASYYDLFETDTDLQSNEKTWFPDVETMMMICSSNSVLSKKGHLAMITCAEQCTIQNNRSIASENPNICPTVSVLRKMVEERYECEKCNWEAMGWNSDAVFQKDVKTFPGDISNDLEMNEVKKCGDDFSRNALGFGECIGTYTEDEQGALFQLLNTIGRSECFKSKFKVSCKRHASRILGKTLGSDEQEFGCPESGCCYKKVVGGERYTLIGKEDTTDYGCMSNCIYTKDGTSQKFCFKNGNLASECTDKNGNQKTTTN